MIEVTNVKTFEMPFDIGRTPCHIGLTHWTEGSGWTVNLTTGEHEVLFEAHDEMLDALLNLHVYASTYKEPTESEAWYK